VTIETRVTQKAHKPIVYVADKEYVSLFFSLFSCKCQIYGVRDKVIKIVLLKL